MSAVPRMNRVDPGPGPTSTQDIAADTTRVMIVDDSITVRTIFSRMIDREDDMAIVAQAGTAEQALMILRSTSVDVILLDLQMPGIGGLEALPRILQTAVGAQVLVVSSLTEEGTEATLAALSTGAADTMLKPRPGGFNEEYRSTLLGKVRALGGKGTPDPTPTAEADNASTPSPAHSKQSRIVAIGASTGGIHALNIFLRKLPKDFDLPILVTQHLPDNFIPVFARQVEVAASREAVLAEEGVAVLPGRIIIAPGHGHMVLRRRGSDIVTGLAYHPVKSGCLPSVDPMFDTACDAFDGHVAGVLLSGMGRDGAEGARKIACAGGSIFAQDEASSAVWGMPRAAVEGGFARAVLPPKDLADKVVASAREQACR